MKTLLVGLLIVNTCLYLTVSSIERTQARINIATIRMMVEMAERIRDLENKNFSTTGKTAWK